MIGTKGILPEIEMSGIDPACGVVDTTYCTTRVLFLFAPVFAKVEVIVSEGCR